MQWTLGGLNHPAPDNDQASSLVRGTTDLAHPCIFWPSWTLPRPTKNLFLATDAFGPLQHPLTPEQPPSPLRPHSSTTAPERHHPHRPRLEETSFDDPQAVGNIPSPSRDDRCQQSEGRLGDHVGQGWGDIEGPGDDGDDGGGTGGGGHVGQGWRSVNQVGRDHWVPPSQTVPHVFVLACFILRTLCSFDCHPLQLLFVFRVFRHSPSCSLVCIPPRSGTSQMLRSSGFENIRNPADAAAVQRVVMDVLDRYHERGRRIEQLSSAGEGAHYLGSLSPKSTALSGEANAITDADL